MRNVMGVSVSKADRLAQQHTKQIDKQLRNEQIAQRRDIKLLLLGAGECGKSTIVKQMQIIHMEGFSKAEREHYVPHIYENTVEAMSTIVAAMTALDIGFEGDAEVVNADVKVLETLSNGFESEDRKRFSAETLEALERLWADAGVRHCLARANEYQLDDSAAYWLSSLARIGAQDYEPSDQDILRTRQRTSGVVEVNFGMKNLNFRLFDVGGQRSERRKWIHCFEGVTAILFIIAMSEYDMVLREDGITNRMRESLKLFETIRNNRYFVATSIILFLNKKDLFEEKIKRSPLTKCFPDYDGPKGQFEPAAEFVKEQFQEVNRQAGKPSYCHLTCATDTQNIQFVFDAAVDVIVANNLKNTGLY